MPIYTINTTGAMLYFAQLFGCGGAEAFQAANVVFFGLWDK